MYRYGVRVLLFLWLSVLIVRNFGRRDAALILWNLRCTRRQVTSKKPLLLSLISISEKNQL
jgi:hypothetical protein